MKPARGGGWGGAPQWALVDSLKHLLHFFKSARAGSMGGVWGQSFPVVPGWESETFTALL